MGGRITFWLLFLGWMVGDGLAYTIGRFAGDALTARLISKADMKRRQTLISRHTTFVTALLFRLAMPDEERVARRGRFFI